MPRPRPPSKVDPCSFPVFGMAWYADPGTGHSLVAYGGGGGSAKTGVHNNIVLLENDDVPQQISTGEEMAVALLIYADPVQKGQIWLVACLGRKIHRFSLSSSPIQSTPHGEIEIGESCNCIAMNSTSTLLGAGCENGVIQIYALDHRPEASGWSVQSGPIATLEAHEKSVCALDFSARGDRLVSAGKDGFAMVWEKGTLLQKLACDIKDDQGPPPKRKQQALVRGCAFADLDGKVVLTVASARKGRAFVSRWIQRDKDYVCQVRTPCSSVPISSINLSKDGGLLALGSVDGSIILWGVQEWQALKSFPEVHDLPVTCIAARPYPVGLRSDEDFVVHARSASADSQLGILTLQRRANRKANSPSGDGSPLMDWTHRLLVTGFLVLLATPFYQDAVHRCGPVYSSQGIVSATVCLRDRVLVAPAKAPGISTPPF